MARNLCKQNVASPLDVSMVADELEAGMRTESTVESDVSMDVLLSSIDAGLPVALRSDYLKMKEGIQVPKARRTLVREAVLKIIKPEVYCAEES